jgi:hypothetical protein
MCASAFRVPAHTVDAAPPKPIPQVAPKLPAAPNALHGIQPAALADELPNTTGADPAQTIGAGDYKLYAQVAKQPDGSAATVYYNAWNTQTKRVDFVVGPDSTAVFAQDPKGFAHAAALTMAQGAPATAWQRESMKVMDTSSDESLGARLRHLGYAWDAALKSPEFYAQIIESEALGTALGTVAARGLAKAEARAEGEALSQPTTAAGSIRNVNKGLPLGRTEGTRTLNCANCSIATDAMLSGSPAAALPGHPTTAAALSTHYGKRWMPTQGTAHIEAEMRTAGPGSRGIVLGERPNGQLGHFFNVVNQDGTIRFLDGQAGGAAKLDNGYSRFWLLRTN